MNIKFFREIFFLSFILFLVNSCALEYETWEVGSLSEVINNYRVENGLPAIPISASLTIVAKAHARDLTENQAVHDECNLHSWSDEGSWSACCYTPDHTQAECMWNKPNELTNYLSAGYEIALYSNLEFTANQALIWWQSSEGHHDVILNRDIWAEVEWNAMGTAIYEGYAIVWFGREIDTNN